MPGDRMRLRPWLEEKINSNSIEGLTWIDKERTMFTIPWKHAALQGWEIIKDACIFRDWAIHTGKYVEGQAADPKTWKANFRCAMNSLPDIEAVKDRSVNKGHMAARVYRMLPVKPRASLRKRGRGTDTKRRLKVKMEEEDDIDSLSSTSQSQTDDDSSSQGNGAESVDSPGSAASDHSYDVPELGSLVEIESDLFPNISDRLHDAPENNDLGHDQMNKFQIWKEFERDSMLDQVYQTNVDSFSPNESFLSAEDNYMQNYTTISADFVQNSEGLLSPVWFPDSTCERSQIKEFFGL